MPVITMVNMAKRMCLACGGELVMAFRPSDVGRSSAPGSPASSNAKWRCGTCGEVFSAEQLRAGKKARAVGQA